MITGTMTSMVHQILQPMIQVGQLFIDATVGNGYDTVFLAKLVGKTGSVIGFDIQEEAILATAKKLKEEKADHQVKLIQDSHAHLDQYVTKPIDGAMFNLGYLPKGDKTKITMPQSTIEAIKKSVILLKPKGIITIVSYYEHEGGEEEKRQVEKYLQALDEKKMVVGRFNYFNRTKCPPILYIIQKK
ncbi:MAG: methyltransferase domain-containing protein [Epulopiscium sp.]|nr:methyltransferase domain-containing protein [Candidatus Epulonipiscium sp.]